MVQCVPIKGSDSALIFTFHHHCGSGFSSLEGVQAVEQQKHWNACLTSYLSDASPNML